MTTFVFLRSPSSPTALLVWQQLPHGSALQLSHLEHPFLWMTSRGKVSISPLLLQGVSQVP